MIDIGNYDYLLDEKIKVIRIDDSEIIGKWVDWTSQQDNEPDP